MANVARNSACQKRTGDNPGGQGGEDEVSPLIRQIDTDMTQTTAVLNSLEKQEHRGPLFNTGQDSPWGWMVVAACFFSIAVLDGICYSFGVFMDPIKDEMDESRAGVAAVGSIQAAMYFFTGPVAARLVDRLGNRPVLIAGAIIAAAGMFISSFSTSVAWLILSFSVLGGIGFGLMFMPALVTPALHFNKRRALACGVAVCGTGIGTLTIPPLANALITAYGWRGALRVISAIVLSCLFCGFAFFKPTNDEESNTSKETGSAGETEADRRREESDQQSEKCCSKFMGILLGADFIRAPDLPVFLIFSLGDFLATLALYIPYSMLPDMAESRGISQVNAAYLISAAGLSSTVGRVVAGWVCDQDWLHPGMITMFANAGAGVSAFLLTSCTSFSSFLVFSSLFGFLTGCWVACEAPMIIRTLNLNLLTSAFGLITFNGGIAALVGPPVAGLIVEESADDKSMAFYMTGSILMGSAAAYALALTVNRFRNRRQSSYEEI